MYPLHLPRPLGALLVVLVLLLGPLSSSGCADLPDNDSTPSQTPIVTEHPRIEVVPNTIDFGPVLLDSTETVPIEIHNLGDSDLYVSTIEIAVGVAFALPDVSQNFTVLPGAFVTFFVSFSPLDELAYGGSLRVESNDEVSPVVTVSLTGSGTRGTDDDGDGVTVEEGDCDDSDGSVYPSAEEACDQQDNDCNDQIDDADQDLDGYSPCATDSVDCVDTDATIYPGAEELCDGLDNDCDGALDEGFDTDEDGTSDCVDNDEDGSSEAEGDCDDTDANTGPDSEEVCDGQDNDCNGSIDEGFDGDVDGDGTVDCIDDDGDGFSEEDGDCNDQDSEQHPGGTELCNGQDDDCDGEVDELANVDQDQDGFSVCDGDCDDQDGDVHPGAVEVCNDRDDDCDAQVDEGFSTDSYYQDTDSDGYGDPTKAETACAAPEGFVANNGDCDDSNAAVHPAATELCNEIDDNCNGIVDDGAPTTLYYRDADGDGQGTSAQSLSACQMPTGYVDNADDCDDANPAIYLGATELCNSIDDDCDGAIDENVATSTWYRDSDGDGFGTSAQTLEACVQPTGFVSNSTDCDDTRATVYPGAPEQCNGIDDDCDGLVDDGVVDSTWYRDADSDGYGSSIDSKSACAQPSGYVLNPDDCNDANASIYPGATETCNNRDDDCDGLIDEGVQSSFYPDGDLDGYGRSGSAPVMSCTAPSGHSGSNSDCDDTNATVHPGATELCNGIDDNCNGVVDDGILKLTWYQDKDGDGYGNSAATTSACSQPTGYVQVGGDCNDANAAVHPGATELCNGVDDDCDGSIDENVKSSFYSDADGDGFGSATAPTTQACTVPTGYVANNGDCNDANAAVHPGATELCNAIDDDCDGVIDEGFSSCNDSDDDGDGYTENQGDCDDNNPGIAPITVQAGYAGTETGSSTQPFNTVQEGIGAASLSCPLVLVKPGTYAERINFLGKGITVRSTSGAAVTTLDGQSGGTVVSFVSNESSSAVLDGFTIKGGQTARGGGIYIYRASPVIQNNVVAFNNATIGGGGIYVSGDPAAPNAPLITQNRIEDNVGATSATGSFAGGGLVVDSSSAIVTGNVFARNRHISGGAIGVVNGNGTLVQNNTFTANTGSDTTGKGTGGAIYAYNSVFTIDANTFSNNVASDAGGAIYFIGTGSQANADLTLTHNTFSGNTAGNVASTSAAGSGGAVFATYCYLRMEGNTYTGNLAARYGGAVYIKGQSTASLLDEAFAANEARDATAAAGGAVYLSESDVQIDLSLFDANKSGYNAGALSTTYFVTLELYDSDFTSNRADLSVNGKAGAAYFDRSDGVVEGNLFEGNKAGYGGGAVIVQDTAVDMFHNRFYANQAPNRGGALWLTSASSGFTSVSNLTNNLIQGNSASAGSGGGVHFNNISASGLVARGAFVNNTVLENSSSGSGAGIYVGTDASATLLNNIVYGNLVKEGIFVSTGSTLLPTVQYNDSFGNAGGQYAGKAGIWPGTGNLEVAPGFVSYSADNNPRNDTLTLTSGSAVKDKGHTSAAYNDADGSRNDMGAYGGPSSSW